MATQYAAGILFLLHSINNGDHGRIAQDVQHQRWTEERDAWPHPFPLFQPLR